MKSSNPKKGNTESPPSPSSGVVILVIDIESARLTKNNQIFGVGKMNPFVTLSVSSSSKQEDEAEESNANGSIVLTRTPTHWGAHKDPVWFHACPRIATDSTNNANKTYITMTSNTVLSFTVYNDSQTRLHAPQEIGCHQISVQALAEQAQTSKHGSLGRACGVQVPLVARDVKLISRIGSKSSGEDTENSSVGSLQLQVKVKDMESFRQTSSNTSITSTSGMITSNSTDDIMKQVDPSWFESPAVRLGVSGGTAPFFKLSLSEKGLQKVSEQHQRQALTSDVTLPSPSESYYIGKDLSHAEDEREFYEQILQIQAEGGERDGGVGLLAPFMFDYLGVLETITTDSDGDDNTNKEGQQETRQLLVMQNLRNNYRTFRMLDLKMGQQTAQGGWQGKSKVAAFRQSLLDGITNSRTEGYRLEGFDGSPNTIDSMDPWLDLLSTKTEAHQDNNVDHGTETETDTNNGVIFAPKTTLWGHRVTKSDIKKAKRFMLQTMTGAEILRYLMDMHLDQPMEVPHDIEFSATNSCSTNQYQATEVAAIVLHELVGKLLHLAVTCQRVEVPQKWIGSSVALGYDGGLFPSRNLNATTDTNTATGEQLIRSKVIVKVFDWGRSELLTRRRFNAMTVAEQDDRQRFWNNYKNGIAKLAYNAARSYYHHFTNAGKWTQLTLRIMDFDSLSRDDYLGQVIIGLPDPSDTSAVKALQTPRPYQLSGYRRGTISGKVHCSISWLSFPNESRLCGSWRVTIQRAEELPAMDPNNLSDPYCVVIARDNIREHYNSKKTTQSYRRELRQVTCIKARSLNPEWNETIDVPIVKEGHASCLRQLLAAQKIFDDSSSFTDQEVADLFQSSESAEWSNLLQKAAQI